MANISQWIIVAALALQANALPQPARAAGLTKRDNTDNGVISGEAGADGHDHFPEKSCPAYVDYSQKKHAPYSDGPLKLPFMRPDDKCRTFKSDLVEEVIKEVTGRMEDKDMARMFENCFPSTLDTTIRWHTKDDSGKGPRSFIITGDINAEWLRDSRNQLKNYQHLAPFDKDLRTLLEGAIHTQAEMVAKQPYCNAFQPPKASGLKPSDNNQSDTVSPPIDNNVVFECKYELDSLAAFFGLANDFYEATGSTDFVNDDWISAVNVAYQTMTDMQTPTFDKNGTLNKSPYTFQRQTDIGTETLPLKGAGNPVNGNTNLIRSAFRPSDDACTFQLFIPANAMASVELKKTGKMLSKMGKHQDLADKLTKLGDAVHKDIYKYGTAHHPDFGKVFSFEVDGYGSHINMDDANVPSLLSLPDLGFCDKDDEVYQATRKMILSRHGNPYYLEGPYFSGIGGPHIGTQNAWPMSHLLRVRTTDDDDEIKEQLKSVLETTDGLGLMHESIRVDQKQGTKDAFTRPWFAWANTEFAQTILDLASRKPYLIFKQDKSEALTLSDFAKDAKGHD